MWQCMLSLTIEMMHKYIKADPPTHNDAYSDPDPLYSSFLSHQQLICVVLLHYDKASKTERIPESQKHSLHVIEHFGLL